ncbi:MAG: HNH endonuclease [Deltaproteobacteria bacterium]|nr:HNH endonuclease [Deltaproteobacteria bacterium]
MKVITWQRAVTLFFLGKVEVVHEYEHEISSVSIAIKMPSVVRLLQFVHLGRRKPPLSKLNVLARDNFSCQYCERALTYRDATFDHVLPRSQGGGNSWTNIVTACHSCNRKKGGKTPQQAKMKLCKNPVEPDWLPVLTMRIDVKLPDSWIVFLSHNADLQN